jgi:hypothetical protein
MSTNTNINRSNLSELPSLLTTSVVRGANQGQSHGGVYKISFADRQVHQLVDWNTSEIDFQGRGWDRGLRGIAFYNEEIYIAASDELFVFDQNFTIKRSFRNAYLKHCHEIHQYKGTLYLASTGFDSILMFDLEQEQFISAIHIGMSANGTKGTIYSPQEKSGPSASNSLHLNNIFVSDRGIFTSGINTGCLLQLGEESTAQKLMKLPKGIHNARPFRNGVLFNDTAYDRVRYLDREGKDLRFRVPRYPPEQLKGTEFGNRKLARQGFARGLCIFNDNLIIAGSSPSTISLYDFESGKDIASINVSMDIRNAVHGLELWPY